MEIEFERPKMSHVKHKKITSFLSLDIRIQLNEQLRCLDGRLESQQGQLAEIQDVFKRRAEIELNYR